MKVYKLLVCESGSAYDIVNMIRIMLMVSLEVLGKGNVLLDIKL